MLLEAKMDIDEGADALIIKPSMFYSDMISRVKDICNTPVIAYQVSGEYYMLKCLVDAGVDQNMAFLESLLSLKRAGADAIMTYAAMDMARYLAG